MTTQPTSLPIPRRVLVVDAGPHLPALVTHELENASWDATCVESFEEAEWNVKAAKPDAAIIDVDLENGRGVEFAHHLRVKDSVVAVVAVSVQGGELLASKAAKAGADFFLQKPVTPAALHQTLAKAVEFRDARQRLRDGATGTAGAAAPSPPSSAVEDEDREIRKLEDIEREEILRALRLKGGNAKEAAKALGIGRSTIYRFIAREEVDLKAFR